MKSLYCIQIGAVQYGPYTIDQMKNFELSASTCVYATNTKEWKIALCYPELLNSLKDDSSNVGELNIRNSTYYFSEEGNIYGPLSFSDLLLLDINNDTFLSINTTNNWHRARNLGYLVQIIEQSRHQENQINQRAVNAPNRNSREVQMMKHKRKAALIVVLTLGLAGVYQLQTFGQIWSSNIFAGTSLSSNEGVGFILKIISFMFLTVLLAIPMFVIHFFKLIYYQMRLSKSNN